MDLRTFVNASPFLSFTLYVDHNALFIFLNATDIEEVMAIQSLCLWKEEFSKTLGTFEGP